MLVSKSIYLLIDDYLQYILIKQKIILLDSNQIFDPRTNLLIGSTGLHKYNLVYKHFFYQELKVTILNGKDFDPSNNINTAKLCPAGIKDFTIGHKFSGFLSYDNTLYYAKTTEFLESKFNILVEKKHVKCFTAHRNIVYLTEFGQIFIIFYQKNLSTSQLEEDLILYTINSPMDSFFSSYNFVVMTRKTFHAEFKNKTFTNMVVNDELDDHTKLNQPIYEETIELYIFDLLDFDLKKINDQNRLRSLSTSQFPEFKELLKVSVGSNISYFLAKDNTLYYCDLRSIISDRLSKEKLELQVFDFFKYKQITHIYSSFLIYFAIEQEKIQRIEYWDNKLVLEWATNIGFVDCVKLLIP